MEGAATIDPKSQQVLQENLEKHLKEWSRGVVFSQDGKILATTFDVDLNEIEDLTRIFDDSENAFRFGAVIDGDHFDVHRFYPTLVYGRRGDSETGEGFCVCKTVKAVEQEGKAKTKKQAGSSSDGSDSSGKCIFTLITYAFPTLSARAIPQLQNFSKEFVEPLL
ncbi:Profilin [Balamuthia mandrillaris]